MKWYFKCFKQYFDFKGRARRKEYWWFVLVNFIIILVLTCCWFIPLVKEISLSVTEEIDINEYELALSLLKSPFLYIFILYYLAAFIPSISVMVRRLHDIGKSGYWVFLYYGGSILGSMSSTYTAVNTAAGLTLGFISVGIMVLFLVWLFTDSSYGPNQYGPNPKDEGNDAPQEQEPIPTV